MMLDEPMLEVVFLVDFLLNKFDQLFSASVCDLEGFEFFDEFFE